MDSQRIVIWTTILMFFLFYSITAVAGWSYMLLRYFVPVLPLMMIVTFDFIGQRIGNKAAAIVLVAICVISIANRNGRFYRFVSGNLGSIAERSGEYADLLKSQLESASSISQLRPTDPVFVALPEHYFLAYPAMGYVTSQPTNTIYILSDDHYANGDLDAFPDHFFLLYSYSGIGLGGDKLNWIKNRVIENEGYVVETKVFQNGMYKSQLVEVRRRSP